MRFYVPNNELEMIEEQRGMEEEKKGSEEIKKAPKKKGSDAEESEDGEDGEDEGEQMTAAKLLHEKIIKAAGIGEFAGEMIATVPEVTMIIPRGKYSFDFYSTFAKLHGKTNDYKIMYKDIQKCFLLPKPGGIHMAYILSLNVPLRQGQTHHSFIALQFDKEKTQKVTINLSKEQLKEQYDDKLPPELDTSIYDVISKLFKFLAKVNILIPGEFKSSKGDEAIKCSVKASDGFLYPLKSSLIFINKPITYIKLSEIKYVEFSRIGSAGMPSSRSFDLTVAKLTDNSTITFSGIDKDEYKNLSAYLKDKNIKMRSVDVETNQHIEMSDAGADEDDEDDSEQPRKGASKKALPRAGKQQQVAAMDDDDSDEDDESFKDEGSNDGSGDEEGGEEEGEDEDADEDDSDGDADMDEGIDKDELKAL